MQTSEQAAKAETKKTATKQPATKLIKHPTEPSIAIELDPRTLIDRWLTHALRDSYATERMDRHCGVTLSYKDGRSWIQGVTCPEGHAWNTDQNRPCLYREPGRYGSSFKADRNGCERCPGWSETIPEMFDRLHGASAKALTAAGVPRPQPIDFVSVRFLGDKIATASSFAKAAQAFKADAEFDPETAFEAIHWTGLDEADVTAALHADGFDESWWQPVPCDSKRRPLKRWHGLAMNATDKGAIAEAQAEIRQAKLKQLEADVAAYRHQRRTELGLL